MLQPFEYIAYLLQTRFKLQLKIQTEATAILRIFQGNSINRLELINQSLQSRLTRLYTYRTPAEQTALGNN